MTEPTGTETTADRVAAAVLAHPAVAWLHGGSFGTIASHLPGRRITGVRTGEDDEGVEVGVVLRLGEPLPEVVTELRERVAGVVGTMPVDITVGDVVTAEEAAQRSESDG